MTMGCIGHSLTSEGSFRIKNGNATACIVETAPRISVFRVILNQSTKALHCTRKQTASKIFAERLLH